MNFNRSILLIALFIVSLATQSHGDECSEYKKWGLPSTGGTLLCRPGYLLSHNPIHKQADWVIEYMTSDKLAKVAERSNAFKADADLPVSERSTPKDYSATGYDKGHMAPAGDNAWSKEAMRTSFLMSNMSPQLPELNRQIWRMLEEHTRECVKNNLVIITGPIYRGGTIKKIGRNKISIPQSYFKIIYSPEYNKIVAFIMPNVVEFTVEDDYITTMKEIEALTEFNFFPAMDKEKKKQLRNVRGSFEEVCK